MQNKHKDSFHSPEPSTLRDTSVNLHLNQVILLVLLNVNHVYVLITCLLNRYERDILKTTYINQLVLNRVSDL